MPIPAGLLFADEAEFQAKFLIPLLLKLGFSTVVNYHGTREFGRDLILSDQDRFGHVVYASIQTKYVATVGMGATGIESVISDAKQSFANPFTHPQTGRRERPSTFYVANAGTFSDQAREYFFNALHDFGDNVRLIDGPALMQMNAWATYNRTAYFKEQLTGLALEIQENANNVTELQKDFEEHVDNDGRYPMHRLRVIATSALLARPIMAEVLRPEWISTYYQQVIQLNALVDSVGIPMWAGDYKKNRLQAFKMVVPAMVNNGLHLTNAIMAALQMIGNA